MRIALYGEVDANLIEGPAIWLASVAEMLAGQRCEVTLLLRMPRRRSEVLATVDAAPGVLVVDPFACGARPLAGRRRLSARGAVRLLEKLDAATRFDAVIVRGRRTAGKAAASAALRGRLACYLTDFPKAAAGFGRLRRAGLARILQSIPLLLCQTPEIAEDLRRCLPNGKTLSTTLLPPVADDRAFGLDRARAPAPGEILRLAYIGKFAPAWNTLEMTALPGVLARRGYPAELQIAGNKFIAGSDRDFAGRMRAALARPGVIWSGGLLRLDALRLAARCHIGLSWRAPQLDASPELSTKLIDYGAIGLPAVCNPTRMHRRLLGADYPLFAATRDETVAAILRAAGDRGIWRAARDAVASLASRHHSAVIGAELVGALATTFGDASQPPSAVGSETAR